MNTLGNILWIIFGGFLIALMYLFGSLVLCITIIGIPFGLQTFKLAGLALFPFGRQVVRRQSSEGCLSILMNVIWVLFAGLEIALTHLVLAVLLGLTIVGIPFAIQHMKLASLALIPFGAEIKDE